LVVRLDGALVQFLVRHVVPFQKQVFPDLSVLHAASIVASPQLPFVTQPPPDLVVHDLSVMNALH
jgi:hypothetical protein